MYLSGPVSYYKYIIGDTEYLLFGDYHIATNDCEFEDITTIDQDRQPVIRNPQHVDISYLLWDIAADTETHDDHELDVYIEEPYILSGNRKYDNNKTNIIKAGSYLFSDFLNHTVTNPKIRAHYVDIRAVVEATPLEDGTKRVTSLLLDYVLVPLIKPRDSMPAITERLLSKVDVLEKIFFSPRGSRSRTSLTEDLFEKELLETMVGSYYDGISSIVDSEQIQSNIPIARPDILWENINGKLIHRTRKQLDALDDLTINHRNIKQTIIEFIMDEYHTINIRDNLARIINDIRNAHRTGINISEIIRYHGEIVILLNRISTLIMDKYALPRLFRDFRTDRRRKSIKIVLAGDIHIIRYNKLFQLLGIKPTIAIPTTRRSPIPTRGSPTKHGRLVNSCLEIL